MEKETDLKALKTELRQLVEEFNAKSECILEAIELEYTYCGGGVPLDMNIKLIVKIWNQKHF